jgi:hypothetical protein
MGGRKGQGKGVKKGSQVFYDTKRAAFPLLHSRMANDRQA